MNPLPHNVAGPLHILPAWLGWIPYIVLAVCVIWVMRRYWRNKEAIATAQVAPSRVRFPPKRNMEKEIHAIESRASKGPCRPALFELSALMREYVDSMGLEKSIAEMTAMEIKRHFTSEEPASFFENLEEPLFSAREPPLQSVRELCRQATTVASSSSKWGISK